MRSTFLIVMVVLLWSCDRQPELCFDHDAHDRLPVKVVFDWSRHPNASPSTLSLYLFPEDGSRYTRHEFTDRTGGLILVRPGRYSAVAVNSDNEDIKIIRSDSFRDFTIALRDAYDTQGLSSSRLNQPLCPSPDSLWIARLDDIYIDGSPIIVTMTDACCHYSVEIRHLRNSHLVESVEATLSGMHRTIINRENEPVDSARLLFTLRHLTDDSLRGDLLTLGHCGLTASRSYDPIHHLGLYLRLGDGSVRYHSEDVTAQIHSQPPERCHIVIDTLDLPPKLSSGGLDFSVDDWNIVDIDVTPNKPN